MAIQRVSVRERKGAEVAGALALVGLAVGALTVRYARPPRGRDDRDRKHAALVAYLHEHLSGADAAINVVERLKETHKNTAEGALFASLDREFRGDRAVVVAMLTKLGASPVSAKRLAGQAAGRVLKAAAGGHRGAMSLFRTLEALAIGVQGKRCLWRMAQRLAPSVQAPGARSFLELEERAVHQWEAIERCRWALVPRTFSV